MIRVILYYNFSPIENPSEFCRAHKIVCASLKLKGRVYISSEGINGTLAGTVDNILKYKSFLMSLEGFEAAEFKEDTHQEIPFYKLIVKTRPEIVSLKIQRKIDLKKNTAPYLEPQQWRAVLENEKDFILLDVRNRYETQIGHFERAVIPEVDNFFDFPTWLENSHLKKDQKILMYCTGGIRCEKFSAFMKEEGFQNVFQLHGGIINYAQKENGKHFRGKCFVFDDRLAVPVNPVDPQPIARCEISGVPCDTYINCANAECNRLYICSREAAIRMEGCCSRPCQESPAKRSFSANDIYTPYRKWCYYTEDGLRKV